MMVCSLMMGCASTDDPTHYAGKFKLPFMSEPQVSAIEQAELLSRKKGEAASKIANALGGNQPTNEITTVPRIATSEKKGILDLSVLSVFGGTPKGEVTSRKLFADAEERFRGVASIQGDTRADQFSKVAKLYKKAAEAWPNSVIEEDAMFMNAESHFFADEYARANETYGELLKKYPNSRHVDQVDKRRFAISQYWIDMKKRATFLDALPNVWDKQRPTFDMFGHATRTLDRIRFDNPTGKLSDDATIAAGVAKFEAGKYSDADILFTDLRENFPSSEHQFQAHLLSLKCKQLTYEGPEYDGGVLDQGEKLIITMYRQFPDQSEQHRPYLDEAFRSIRLKKAQREHNLAQYYDRRKEYRAARHYYEIVKREFADTNLALDSEKRIAELTDLPDTPPDRMAWLTQAFPANHAESKPLLAPRSGTKLR